MNAIVYALQYIQCSCVIRSMKSAPLAVRCHLAPFNCTEHWYLKSHSYHSQLTGFWGRHKWYNIIINGEQSQVKYAVPPNPSQGASFTGSALYNFSVVVHCSVLCWIRHLSLFRCLCQRCGWDTPLLEKNRQMDQQSLCTTKYFDLYSFLFQKEEGLRQIKNNIWVPWLEKGCNVFVQY